VETGGRRRHIAYAWEYKWRGELASWTLCRVGRHRAVKVWRGHIGVPGTTTFVACANCATWLREESV
jgi:hypothetical protein